MESVKMAVTFFVWIFCWILSSLLPIWYELTDNFRLRTLVKLCHAVWRRGISLGQNRKTMTNTWKNKYDHWRFYTKRTEQTFHDHPSARRKPLEVSSGITAYAPLFLAKRPTKKYIPKLCRRPLAESWLLRKKITSADYVLLLTINLPCTFLQFTLN